MNLKTFFAELVLVFLGALLALFTQDWSKTRTERSDALIAQQEVEEELRGNLDKLTRQLERQKFQEALLSDSEMLLGTETFALPDLSQRAAKVAAKIDAKLKEQKRGLGLQIVAYHRAAWDTAVARGDLRHFSKGKALAYARTYSVMNETAELLRGALIQGPMTRHVSTIDMYGRGESKDSLAFARSIRDLHQLTKVVDVNLEYLQASMKTALSASPSGGASAPTK